MDVVQTLPPHAEQFFTFGFASEEKKPKKEAGASHKCDLYYAWRRFCAALTMLASAARVSVQPLVFRPQSGFTTGALRDTLRGFFQQRFNPLHARHVRGVNVVHAGPIHSGSRTLRTTPAAPYQSARFRW